MKVKVKLNKQLDSAKKGFVDITNGQKIRPKEFGKSEVFEVKDSPFVRSKIANLELILVEEIKEESKEKKESK